jgi:hypothetical protein
VPVFVKRPCRRSTGGVCPPPVWLSLIQSINPKMSNNNNKAQDTRRKGRTLKELEQVMTMKKLTKEETAKTRLPKTTQERAPTITTTKKKKMMIRMKQMEDQETKTMETELTTDTETQTKTTMMETATTKTEMKTIVKMMKQEAAAMRKLYN